MPQKLSEIGDERRLFERFDINFSARMRGCNDDSGNEISLINISARGISFRVKGCFLVEDKISLDIAIPDGKSPMLFKGEVVWADCDEFNDCKIGLKFRQINLVRMSRLYKYIAADPSTN